MNRQQLPAIVAWGVAGALVVATLGPVGIRPSLDLPLKVERFLGFAVVAALFTWAYPKRWIAILVLASCLAVGLEVLQLVAPGRDASPIDAAVKIMGAIAGTAMVHLLQEWLRRRREP